jgi:hypothetical protein
MITNEKKKMRQKTPKIVGKCQILPIFDFSDQNFKFKSQIDLKLTILVVL